MKGRGGKHGWFHVREGFRELTRALYDGGGSRTIDGYADTVRISRCYGGHWGCVMILTKSLLYDKQRSVRVWEYVDSSGFVNFVWPWSGSRHD